MRHHLRVTLGVTLIGVVLTGVVSLSGCKKSSEEPSSEASTKLPDGTEDPNGTPSGSPTGIPDKQPRHAKPVMPEVKLTELFAKTCLVQVKDEMPDDVTLNDLHGQPVKLSSLVGKKKLTVVYFWKVDPAYGNAKLRQLHQLQTNIAKEYGPEGVEVVAINVGNPPLVANEAFRKEKATYPYLFDPRGEYFKQVATEGVSQVELLPRVYLLDSVGKILWFDVEFSEISLEDLDMAIRFTLEKDKTSKGENE